MNKIYYTQPEVNKMIFDLLMQIESSGRVFKAVVGIARGGINISRPIAKHLNLNHHKIKISCYQGTQMREDGEEIAERLPDLPTSNCLIVDDLIDTGKTLRVLNRLYKFENSAVGVLFWNPNSTKPDFYAQEKPPYWIVFPWEINNADNQ